MEKALQDLINPEGVCFGCGPTNPMGLRIKSYPAPDGLHVLANITPRKEFCGMPELVYGGYLAMLADCHSSWACIYHHYKAEGREPGSHPKVSCATARLNLSYLKPTPMGVALELKAWPDGPVGRKTNMVCEIYAGSVLTVRAESVFVRINPEVLSSKAYGG